MSRSGFEDMTDAERRAYETGTWLGYPNCPCSEPGCYGQKLLKATGHVKGCSCPRCRGRESNRKGHRNQDRTHKALGGSGRARHDEASQKPYVVEITVMPEAKAGQQIPKSLSLGLGSEWLRRAFSQAERAAPVGSNVLPAVSVGSDYLIVDLRRVNRLTVAPHSTSRRPLPE